MKYFTSIMALTVLCGVAGAATLTVDDDGGADYTQIQDAIDNARAGDVVDVQAGEYIEHVVISKNNISLIGADAENTTINSGGVGAAIFLKGANNTVVSNFTILNDPAMAVVFADVDYNYSRLTPAAYDSPLPANYSLVVRDISAHDSPRMAWLTLSNGSGRLDDKIVSAGETFEIGYGTWQNRTTILNATVESIFAGHDADLVILNHTTLYDTDGVPVLSDARLILVVGGATPVLYTSGGVEWQLEEGYTLTVGDVDAKTSPRQVWIRLSKNGVVLDERVLSEGETYSYYKNGDLVLSAQVDKIFSSGNFWAVTFSSVNQYSETTHNLLLSEPDYMFKNADVSSKNNWSLYENYNLSVIGIDETARPRQVMLQLSKNNVAVDTKITGVNEEYNYTQNETVVITANVRDIFKGFKSALVTLDNVYQYSDATHNLLINNATHSYSVGNLKGVDWQLCQGYTLSAVDIDSNLAPPSVWLRLSKNGTLLDEQVVSEGENYTYHNGARTILSARINTVFDGANTGRVNITNVYQYDENTGNTLINNASHAMIFGDVIKGETWYLYENYAITPMDIDVHTNPRRAWLRFTKNNNTVDKKIVADGDNYTYYKNGQLIFTAYLDAVFSGATSRFVLFKYVRQYSEIDGSLLIESGRKKLTSGTSLVRGRYNKGILLYNSYENNISNNFIKLHFYGIYAIGSSNNMLTGNNVSNNNWGIRLHSSNDNTIYNNNASNNYYGIYLYHSSNNTLYLNNLVNNTYYNAYDNGNNQWDNGAEGNYYSDYNGTDSNGDGIGDTPYNISGGAGAQDRYPLVSAWVEDTVPPVSITGLTAFKGVNWLKWVWVNPTNADFSHVMVYLDGNFTANVTENHYNATGYAPDSEHTISTRTVDTSGNINQTWVNHTARTAPVESTPLSTPKPKVPRKPMAGKLEVILIPEHPTVYDNVSMEVRLTYLTAGYKVEFGNASIENNTILVDVDSQEPKGMAAQVISIYSEKYNLGHLSEGAYTCEVYINGVLSVAHRFMVSGSATVVATPTVPTPFHGGAWS